MNFLLIKTCHRDFINYYTSSADVSENFSFKCLPFKRICRHSRRLGLLLGMGKFLTHLRIHNNYFTYNLYSQFRARSNDHRKHKKRFRNIFKSSRPLLFVTIPENTSKRKQENFRFPPQQTTMISHLLNFNSF